MDDLRREPLHERRLVRDSLIVTTRGETKTVVPTDLDGRVDEGRATSVLLSELLEEGSTDERGLIKRDQVCIRRVEEDPQGRCGRVGRLGLGPESGKVELCTSRVEEPFQLDDELVEKEIGGAVLGRRIKEAGSPLIYREQNLLWEFVKLHRNNISVLDLTQFDESRHTDVRFWYQK